MDDAGVEAGAVKLLPSSWKKFLAASVRGETVAEFGPVGPDWAGGMKES